MAVSLLRFGRLGSFKSLQVNSWIGPKNGPALWFCTQTNEPTKPAKKIKAAGKTAAPEERAALLAHRTAVSFPVKLLEPGGFPLGGAEDSVPAAPAPPAGEPLADVDGKSSTPEEAPGLTGATGNSTTASSEPKDPSADKSSSSSSSSDSDSDSDSDSEDNKLEEEAEIRNVQPEFAEAAPGVSKGTAEVEVEHEAAGAAQHPETGARDGAERSEKFSPEPGPEAPADVREGAAAPLVPEAHRETAPLQVAPAQPPVQVSAEPAGVSEESQSGPPEPAAGAETLSPAEDLKDPGLVSAEDLMDPGLVSAEDLMDPGLVSAEDLKDPGLVSAEDLKDPGLVSAEDLKDPGLVSAEDLMDPGLVSAEDLMDPGLVSAEDLMDPGLVSAEDLKDPGLVSAEDLKDPGLVSAEDLMDPGLVSAEDLKDPGLVSAEDLMDPGLVSAEAAGEDLPVGPAAGQLEEPAAAAAPPEPEEPFDNSTYKNCQHHSYTPFTFVDLDVDMAKYRLPQPSSGRASPRH